MAMSPDPETKSNVRVTVTATAVIINLVVILILDEIYGAVAVWLTELGRQIHSSLLLYSGRNNPMDTHTEKTKNGAKSPEIRQTNLNKELCSVL